MVDQPQDPSRQRRDALLGKLAYDQSLLTIGQLKAALNLQLEDARQGRHPARPLAQILMEEGYLTAMEITELQQAIKEESKAPSYLPLGKFRLERELGRGAMGVVYKAFDTERGSRVALKMLLDAPNRANPEEERFLREAELASALPPHPHVVRVIEAGTIEGKRYLAMELIEGVALSDWRRQGSLTMRQHIALLRDVARAVHHAHEHGLIHRDLKPENILVDANHEPHITDFGLAKPVGGQSRASMTAEGMSVGTPAYMSPEQIQGRKDVDRRTDVFSLGVILYETLTGRLPFPGETPFEMMRKTVQEPVIPPSRITKLVLNPVLYTNLENICLIALAKDPKQRYSDAEAFANDLTRWLEGQDVKTVVPKTVRAFRARNPLRRPVVAAGILAVIGLTALAAFFLSRPGTPGRSLPPGTLAAVEVADPAALLPGAVLEYYSGLHFNALGVRKADTRRAFYDPKDPAWPEGPAFYASRRWTGLIRVDRTGPYVFRLKTAEGGRLRIGGKDIFWEAGWTAQTEALGRALLEEGHHRVTVEYFHSGNDARLSLEWKPDETAEFTALSPASFLHRAGSYKIRVPPDDNGPVEIPGAQEGESLEVLEASNVPTVSKTYGPFRLFWKGNWSGEAHLWWGMGVKVGDRLKVRFQAPASGRGTFIAAFTRASDHGIFKVAVNGEVVREMLDLYHPDLVTGEVEFPNVALFKGYNEIEFTVVGTNPEAREWGPGGGLYKIGLDYIRVR